MSGKQSVKKAAQRIDVGQNVVVGLKDGEFGGQVGGSFVKVRQGRSRCRVKRSGDVQRISPQQSGAILSFEDGLGAKIRVDQLLFME